MPSSRPLITLSLVAACVLSAACGTDPVVPTSISHHNAASITGVAGEMVTTPPAVRLVDASGNPTPNITVTWTVIAGEGSVGAATSKTDADGIATVTSWTLGTLSGSNRLRASTQTLTGVEFEAIAAAGAATSIVVHAGNNQTVLVGQILPVNPAVKVVDQYGNGKSGVQVTFAVATGGGLLTGTIRTTGNDGVATIGSWRLGATAGQQQLSASSQALATVQISATGTVSPQCSVADPYTLFNTVAGSLTFEDCLLPNTFYHDFLQVNVPAPQPLRFNMQSTTLDPYILIVDPNGNVLAEDDDGAGVGSTNASLSILAGTGSYFFLASTAIPYQLGSYSVNSTTDDGQATNCEVIFATRGVSISQNLTASDCFNPGGPFYSDQFIIRLMAGIPVTISMSSTAFDTYLELYGFSSVPVAVSDNISGTNLNSEIVYTPTANSYYFISASSFLQDTTGPYSISIAPAAAGSLMASSMEAVIFRFTHLRKK